MSTQHTCNTEYQASSNEQTVRQEEHDPEVIFVTMKQKQTHGDVCIRIKAIIFRQQWYDRQDSTKQKTNQSV